MAPFAALAALIAAQRGHLFLWAPVCFGLGIGLFFGLKTEPAPAQYAVAILLCLLCMIAAQLCGETAGPILAALAVVIAGGLTAGARTHMQAAPVLEFRYYGPVEGRVVAVDRSASDALRVTLDRVVLLRVDPGETPLRVRVSLHGKQGFVDPLPGMRVMATAHLGPPEGPVEPYGFDFQRLAWFARIGAVGYTRTPMLALAPPAPAEPVAALNRFRLEVSAHVQAALPGQRGAFAAAVMTGDRSGLSAETLDAMRDSNLAHLLAISGLHVGLLTGFIFVTLRSAIALVPRLALRLPAKKIAAVMALAAAAAYLALSGGNVSTQRAFIMVAVMLVAVLLDRRALTLRSVALAAMIVLVLRPEALMGPGFQMSFAATTALVWAFAGLRGVDRRRIPRWMGGIVGLVVSSAVAGLATAPFAAAHFNQSASYGLIANLVSVPLMGSLVIPAAVLAACLAPLGLDQVGLWAMGLGIDWILLVAQTVAGWEGAVRHIKQPAPPVLPLFVLAMLWLILWQGRLRMAGLAAACVAAGLWIASDRPPVLIAQNAALVGIMTPEGRALSRERGHGFVATSWLENDGRDRDRDAASRRAADLRDDGALRAAMGDARLAVVFGDEVEALDAVCRQAAIVVSNRAVAAPPDGCIVLDPAALADSGALALRAPGHGDPVVSVRDVTGRRVWNDASLRGGRPRDRGRGEDGGNDDAAVLARLRDALGAPAGASGAAFASGRGDGAPEPGDPAR